MEQQTQAPGIVISGDRSFLTTSLSLPPGMASLRWCLDQVARTTESEWELLEGVIVLVHPGIQRAPPRPDMAYRYRAYRVSRQFLQGFAGRRPQFLGGQALRFSELTPEEREAFRSWAEICYPEVAKKPPLKGWLAVYLRPCIMLHYFDPEGRWYTSLLDISPEGAPRERVQRGLEAPREVPPGLTLKEAVPDRDLAWPGPNAIPLRELVQGFAQATGLEIHVEQPAQELVCLSNLKRISTRTLARVLSESRYLKARYVPPLWLIRFDENVAFREQFYQEFLNLKEDLRQFWGKATAYPLYSERRAARAREYPPGNSMKIRQEDPQSPDYLADPLPEPQVTVLANKPFEGPLEWDDYLEARSYQWRELDEATQQFLRSRAPRMVPPETVVQCLPGVGLEFYVADVGVRPIFERGPGGPTGKTWEVTYGLHVFWWIPSK